MDRGLWAWEQPFESMPPYAFPTSVGAAQGLGIVDALSMTKIASGSRPCPISCLEPFVIISALVAGPLFTLAGCCIWKTQQPVAKASQTMSCVSVFPHKFFLHVFFQCISRRRWKFSRTHDAIDDRRR